MSLPVALGVLLTAIPAGPPVSAEAIERALAAEASRIEVVARIAPAVVSLFDEEQSGGGSGVMVDAAGYGLTNFHVVMGMMQTRRGKGGLSDGKLYDLQVLGIDVTGDVAMFRLTGKDAFAFAELGDSDGVKPGDGVMAMGNPFTLSEDYAPTVTTGVVTGIHRFQGEGDTLVYTDAIQTDASINPGNSGGPLFDRHGKVIGINGRISAEMHKYARGRFNVGLGYAITINQIKRFMPSLRAGLLAKHGTLLATVSDDLDGAVFDQMYEDAPAWNAGIRVGNRLLRFGGRDIQSANQFLSQLGTYPEGWPVPIRFESFGRVVDKVVRLEGVVPPMRQPFEPDAAVNRAAVERVLSAFRKAVCGADRETPPRRWNIRSERKWADGRTTQYVLEDERGRDAMRTELDASGEAVRRIEADALDAFWTERGERYTLGVEETLLYTGLYVLQWVVLGDEVHDGMEQVRHAGSDAVVAIDSEGRITQERLLEALTFPLTEHRTMQVGFDVETHLPVRLVLTDTPTNTVVEVEFRGGTEAADDGTRWPTTMEVRSEKLKFVETLSERSLSW
ncbi:MAG: trypsin-like serine protease [Phycisphaerales bacterium]|nr:trypsin-like serine protease [Phycisphaerales bacterium]